MCLVQRKPGLDASVFITVRLLLYRIRFVVMRIMYCFLAAVVLLLAAAALAAVVVVVVMAVVAADCWPRHRGTSDPRLIFFLRSSSGGWVSGEW